MYVSIPNAAPPPGRAVGKLARHSFKRTEKPVHRASLIRAIPVVCLLFAVTTAAQVQPAPAKSNPSKIAFVSNQDGNAEIYVMDGEGSNLTRLTNNPGFDGAPTWSPDGTRIAFASSRNDNADIYIMNADGSNVVRLTTHAANDGGPSWSADGSMIAFDSNRSGSSQVWRTNVDAGNWGYNLTQLTDDHPLGRVNNFLAWSPDGLWIAFEADRDRDDPEIYLANAVDGHQPATLDVHPCARRGAHLDTRRPADRLLDGSRRRAAKRQLRDLHHEHRRLRQASPDERPRR